MTVFVPADSKERSDELVIELTVPIEAEATASPVAITTSELTPGTPAGLQLSASSQSELTAPVHVDLLMTFLSLRIDEPQQTLPETATIAAPAVFLLCDRLASRRADGAQDSICGFLVFLDLHGFPRGARN